jgi:hypothetical protein
MMTDKLNQGSWIGQLKSHARAVWLPEDKIMPNGQRVQVSLPDSHHRVLS